jgi:hypothetical protein
VPALAALAVGAWRSERGRPFLPWAAAVWLLGMALGLALGGRQFLEQVFLFHADKGAQAGEGARRLLAVAGESPVLLVGGLAGGLLAAARARHRQARGVAGVAVVVLVGQAAAAMCLHRVFSYYLLPWFGAAALGLALGLATAAESLLAGGAAGARRVSVGAGLTLVIAAAVVPPGRPLQAGVPLDSYPALVAAVMKEKEAHPQVALFGDALAVPAVALAARVPVAGDFMDTNPQRFEAGAATFAEVRRVLEATPQALVLVRSWTLGGARGSEGRDYLLGRYQPIATFDSRWGYRHVLLRRQDRP